MGSEEQTAGSLFTPSLIFRTACPSGLRGDSSLSLNLLGPPATLGSTRKGCQDEQRSPPVTPHWRKRAAARRPYLLRSKVTRDSCDHHRGDREDGEQPKHPGDAPPTRRTVEELFEIVIGASVSCARWPF